MTKECVAIKTGMLLKYADEPSWVIVSNDLNELKEIEKMFIQTWRWYRHPIYKRRRVRRKREVPFLKEKKWV